VKMMRPEAFGTWLVAVVVLVLILLWVGVL
jgi:hypothetical protein